jgi:hypothetical protein
MSIEKFTYKEIHISKSSDGQECPGRKVIFCKQKISKVILGFMVIQVPNYLFPNSNPIPIKILKIHEQNINLKHPIKD